MTGRARRPVGSFPLTEQPVPRRSGMVNEKVNEDQFVVHVEELVRAQTRTEADPDDGGGSGRTDTNVFTGR